MDFLNTPEKRERRLVHLPMGRFGEAVEGIIEDAKREGLLRDVSNSTKPKVTLPKGASFVFS